MGCFFEKGNGMNRRVKSGKRRTFSQRYFTDPLTGILVLAMWGVFKIMPVDMASACGAAMGTVLGTMMRGKNKTAMHNLRKCLPDKTKAQHRAIVSGMWRHFGRMVGELPHMEKMYDRSEIIGLENIRAARDDAKGGFFCSAHLGNWELCGLITHKEGMPLHLVYRAANNPWTEKWLYQKRRLSGVCLIPKGLDGAKMMVDLIKKGEHIGMLCDQKLKEGIDVPFFGYPAKTAPAIATMALKMQVPIYPARVIRMKGAHYRVEVLPAMAVPDTGDKNQDVLNVMTNINALLTQWISEHPEQWLWIHHRWPKSEYKH